MNKEFKKAIINYIFENQFEFNLVNATTEKFKLYIYDGGGEYLIGGDEVSNFITKAVKLIWS